MLGCHREDIGFQPRDVHAIGQGKPDRAAMVDAERVAQLLGKLTVNLGCRILHVWETGSQAKAGIEHWMTFYNHHRPHSSLGGTLPAVFYRRNISENQLDQQVQKVA